MPLTIPRARSCLQSRWVASKQPYRATSVVIRMLYLSPRRCRSPLEAPVAVDVATSVARIAPSLKDYPPGHTLPSCQLSGLESTDDTSELPLTSRAAAAFVPSLSSQIDVLQLPSSNHLLRRLVFSQLPSQPEVVNSSGARQWQ